MLIRKVLLLFFLLLIKVLTAQNLIQVNNSSNPQSNFTIESLVKEVLVSGGDCSQVSNVSVYPNLLPTDFLRTYGYFTRANSNFPLQDGIVLTTGYTYSVGSPYDANDITGVLFSGTDEDLATALGFNKSNLEDATYFQFDFVPEQNTISFRYLFASEEYTKVGTKDYPCSFTDGFALLIKKAGDPDFTNIAVLPNGNSVSVQNIRPNISGGCSANNSEYFEGFNPGSSYFTGSVNQATSNFNGQTKVLTATTSVIPGQKYTFKFVLADFGDNILDSAVFIEANSFNSGSGVMITDASGNDLGSLIQTCSAVSTLYAQSQNAVQYNWYLDSGSGYQLMQSGSSNILNIYSVGKYKVEAITAAGCSAIDEITFSNNVSPPPTVSSPVNYCLNQTAVALTATGSNLQWYDSLGNLLSAAPTPDTSVAGTTDYYVSQTLGSCESAKAKISIVVSSSIASPTVSSPVNYCLNQTAVALTATGSNLQWYDSLGNLLSAAPTPDTSVAGTTDYYVSQTLGSCESAKAKISIVVSSSIASPTVSSPVNYCLNQTAVALTATGSNLQWYDSLGNLLSAAPTPDTSVAGTTDYYVSQTLGSCESAKAKISVVVSSSIALPTVSSPVNYCLNEISTTLTATGSNLQWYDSLGNLLSTAPTPDTSVAGTTDYYVSQTLGSCESAKVKISIVVSSSIASPTVSSPVNYCLNQTAVALTATGSNLQWYDSLGNVLSTAPTPDTSVAGTTDYYVSQTLGSCESAKAKISIVVSSSIALPTVSSPVNYCLNEISTTLTATGSNLQWYDSLGNLLSTAPTPDTSVAGTTDYYVSQTLGSCESAKAKISIVVSSSIASPTVSSPVNYCLNQTAVALTATGSNLQWYDSLGNLLSTAPTPDTSVAGTTDYYVSQTLGSCESAKVKISIVVSSSIALPTVSSPVNYCLNQTAVALTATGSNLQWYDSLGNVLSTAPTPDTSVAGTTDYYVSQTLGSCESAKAKISVVVIATPIITSIISGINYLIINAEGGILPYEYSIDNQKTWQLSNRFDNLSFGEYDVWVRTKDSDCSSVSTGIVLNLPNVLTPNGDGINDLLDFSILDNFSKATLSIYNRYGLLLYKTDKKGTYIWDGKYLKRVLPTTSYWYVVELEDGNSLTGFILLKNRN